MDEYELLNYFTDDYAEYWRNQIKRCNFEKADYLFKILENGTFTQIFGEVAGLKILADGESIISFCVQSDKAFLLGASAEPSFGFVYISSQYNKEDVLEVWKREL